MDRADAAGVAGAPGLQKLKRLCSADFADRDAIRPQAERRADKVRKRRHAVLRSHRDEIGRGALKLARIFDQHDTIRGLRNFGEQRVGERGFSSARTARHQNIFPLGHCTAEDLGREVRHDTGDRIIVKAEHRDGGLPDGEGRRCHHRRQQPFEALAGLREFGRNARRARVDCSADMMRDEANDAFAIGPGEKDAAVGDADAQPVHPKPTIGVEHDLDDRGVGQPFGDGAGKRGPEHARAA